MEVNFKHPPTLCYLFPPKLLPAFSCFLAKLFHPQHCLFLLVLGGLYLLYHQLSSFHLLLIFTVSPFNTPSQLRLDHYCSSSKRLLYHFNGIQEDQPFTNHFEASKMSYSIRFLPPSQPSIPVERRSRPPRHATSEPSRPASCHMSRVYLDKLSDQQKAIVKPLLARVEHWKGHCLCSFGKPLLQAKVMVSRRAIGGDGQVEDTIIRQYQVFLFSNILICCRKRARPNAQGKDWALKGRVFLRNIYDVQQTGGEWSFSRRAIPLCLLTRSSCLNHRIATMHQLSRR